MDLAAWRRLSSVLIDLKLFDAFNDFDSVEAHLNPKVFL